MVVPSTRQSLPRRTKSTKRYNPKSEILKNVELDEWLWNGEFESVADEILSLPLDVPSDEEVEKSCTQVLTPRIASFLQGARWMRKEIIQRNTHEIDHK
jgi:hypothetical protein